MELLAAESELSECQTRKETQNITAILGETVMSHDAPYICYSSDSSAQNNVCIPQRIKQFSKK
jgi:hypothetical protein